MKIGQPAEIAKVATAQPPAGAAAAAAAKKDAAATATSTASSAGVAVTVSASVRDLEQANRADAGEVDTAKVEAVRAAIADGSYVVNAEAIADKLLDNAREMLDRAR